MTARHVVLVGLMGAGKSTVGRLLAAEMGRPFVDSDVEIEVSTGRTVREIWMSDGEPAFRALEERALRDALASETPSVIAAAGGVVLSAENRGALHQADAIVVWLKAAPGVLAERAERGDHRPLLDGQPEAVLAGMATNREALYGEVADIVVDVGSQSVDEVTADVLGVIGAVDHG